MINELADKSTGNLEFRLKALEAQLRCTEIQIKETKEELERRKQRVPLGVPIKGTLNEMPYEAVNKGFLEWFSSEASADKFEEYFAEYVKALQDIAEGKLIDIKVLLPLLPKGYVAMEQDAKWYWYANEPVICGKTWIMRGPARSLNAFNIKAAEDWTQSLKE